MTTLGRMSPADIRAAKKRKRHGGPYDRGSADAYYGRPFAPHYFEGDTYSSPKIEAADMTPAEIADYRAGFEEEDDMKDFGR